MPVEITRIFTREQNGQGGYPVHKKMLCNTIAGRLIFRGESGIAYDVAITNENLLHFRQLNGHANISPEYTESILERIDMSIAHRAEDFFEIYDKYTRQYETRVYGAKKLKEEIKKCINMHPSGKKLHLEISYGQQYGIIGYFISTIHIPDSEWDNERLEKTSEVFALPGQMSVPCITKLVNEFSSDFVKITAGMRPNGDHPFDSTGFDWDCNANAPTVFETCETLVAEDIKDCMFLYTSSRGLRYRVWFETLPFSDHPDILDGFSIVPLDLTNNPDTEMKHFRKTLMLECKSCDSLSGKELRRNNNLHQYDDRLCDFSLQPFWIEDVINDTGFFLHKIKDCVDNYENYAFGLCRMLFEIRNKISEKEFFDNGGDGMHTLELSSGICGNVRGYFISAAKIPENEKCPDMCDSTHFDAVPLTGFLAFEESLTLDVLIDFRHKFCQDINLVTFGKRNLPDNKI